MAKAERARIQRRRSHPQQNPDAKPTNDFERVFECLPGQHTAADASCAATDLQECSRRYNFPAPMCLTPMERFLVIDPVNELWSIDSEKKQGAIPVREGSRACASRRVQRAIDLAAEVSTTRRLAAFQRPTRTEEAQVMEGNERSWLDLDADSQVSCSGGSRSLDRGRECTSPRARCPQAS